MTFTKWNTLYSLSNYRQDLRFLKSLVADGQVFANHPAVFGGKINSNFFARSNNDHSFFSRFSRCRFVYFLCEPLQKADQKQIHLGTTRQTRLSISLFCYDCSSPCEMIKCVLTVTLLVLFQSIENSDATSIGLIPNVSLWFSNASPSLIDGDCQQCLCSLTLNPNFSSFNCYTNNQTCQIHHQSDQNQSFQLIPSLVSVFYFLSLPTVQSTANTYSCQQTLNGSIGKICLRLKTSLRREKA